ncbi:DUF2515 family protein [Paenibacillus hemerocallicola]|nr:DUF2515 family protein [Paenibacillus hemerocallicola]
MNRMGERNRLRDIWNRLLTVPGNMTAYWTGKVAGWLQSAKLSGDAVELSVTKEEIRSLRKLAASFAEKDYPGTPPRLTAEEISLVQSIRDETKRCNRNNVTRTMAYWRVFERSPVLQWAFLAHMVSRNGGWSMTDLKGELYSRLLAPDRSDTIFDFLESANSLIFQDAYPQLRLYESSMERRRNLFHLLPVFGVSAFMRPVWEQFWREGNSALLTVGLIVNEQHYIEGRVVQDERFRRAILDTADFQAQTVLQLNCLLFPYAPEGALAHPEASSQPRNHRLAGLILEDFSDLSGRIEFGKALYAILFAVPAVAKGVRDFASSRTHTGSRADYWPGIFATLRSEPPKAQYVEKLDGGILLPGATPLYSPKLEQAWKDKPFTPPDRYDWYRLRAGSTVSGRATDRERGGNDDPFRYFGKMRPPLHYEMTNEYSFALNKLELAVLAGDMLFD